MKVKMKENICIIDPCYPQIDALNLGVFQSDIKAAIGDNKRILIDFSGTRFIDSSGLGVLLGIFRTLSQRDGKMVLCCMNSAVSTVFDMVKLPDIIPCFEEMDKAFSYIKSV